MGNEPLGGTRPGTTKHRTRVGILKTVLAHNTILEHGPMAPRRSQTCLDRVDLDPDFIQSRREMIVILIAFFCSLIWTIGVSFAAGYPQRTIIPSELTLVWGMPSWVFWGILLPWLVIDVVAVWFCFFYMQDDFSKQSHDTQEAIVSERDRTAEELHER